MNNILGYQNENVVVTGAASGMGAGCVQRLLEVGANVYALDINDVDAPVSKSIKVNIMDKESITAAVAELPGEIFSLFNCAGVPCPPAPTYNTMMINFVGMRELTRQLLPRMKKNSSIASVSSTAGMAWRSNRGNVDTFLANDSFESAAAWLQTEEGSAISADAYAFSKQSMIVYMFNNAAELARRHIRINTICPSPTESAFTEQMAEIGLGRDITDFFTPPNGLYATGSDMGDALVAINSNLFRFVSGCLIPVDWGYTAEITAGQRDNLLNISL
ncbi:MAG: SDR family oxidoreductase [Halioglobus sp.]|nr:SDR family oxidoreductase [Halioglobus sp.]